MHGTSVKPSEQELTDREVTTTAVGRCEATACPGHVVVHADEPLEGGYGCYGLGQLLRAAGLRWVFERGGEPTIYYGSEAKIGRRAALWIPASRDCATSSPFCDSRGEAGSDSRAPLTTVDGVPVLHDGHPPSRLFVDNRMTFDVARATAFWLTLDSERYATERDEHGRVPARASLIGAGDWLHRPPVQRYADLVKDHLARFLPAVMHIPRWPCGKKYAVALTHDVDDPERPSRLPSLVWRLLVGGGVRRRETYWEMAAEIRSRGLRDTAFVRPTQRPAWDFGEFCRIEQRYGLRSAFYFAVVDRRGGHPLDVCYDVSRARYRRLIRRIESDGWEIGLHAAYLTQAGRPDVKPQLERLDALNHRPIVGVRHHYLQFDQGDHPMRSLAAHAAAGLGYDTSIGFNDHPGFRAGTALPYHPWIPATPTPTPSTPAPTTSRSATSTLATSTPPTESFLELPMSLADMHLEGLGESEAVDVAIRHLEAARELGGLAVLNWHVGRWHSDPTWRAAYQAVCRFLGDDDSAWVALPRDIHAFSGGCATDKRLGLPSC